jgi:hypothetical protein
VHDAHQLIGRCGGKALLRKKPYGRSKSFIWIELSRSSHVPSQSPLGDVSTVYCQVCTSDEPCLL